MHDVTAVVCDDTLDLLFHHVLSDYACAYSLSGRGTIGRCSFCHRLYGLFDLFLFLTYCLVYNVKAVVNGSCLHSVGYKVFFLKTFILFGNF
jgi:hypothetical protein